ncbi:MAG TPA: GNAT family N-acetyltransferase [Thermoanaerobaculia bacterium]|nr:GNAT family N-acetyltransferase [Thermoanaerobaculia bacterium]
MRRNYDVLVIESLEELRAIAAEWDALWRGDANATPFQSPHWLLPWWEHFGSGELAVIAHRDGGVLRALVPLYVLREDDESLGMLIGTGISDYLDAIGNADDLLAPLASIDCQLWDLQQLRPSSPLLTAPSALSSNIDQQDACPVVALAGIKPRKNLDYYRRHANATYEAATSANLDELLSALFSLHAARWESRGLPGVLGDPVTQDFHRDVARRMLAAGALRMYAMRVEARIIAIFYGFAHAGTTYYYLGGHDPAHDKLSAGTLVVAHAIGEAVRKGQTTFDFLRGAEEYKYAWGATDRMNRRRQLS